MSVFLQRQCLFVTPVRLQHSLDSDDLPSFLKDFAIIHSSRSKEIFKTFPLSKQESQRPNRTWLSGTAGKLSCSSHRQAMKWGGTKPSSVWEAAVVPQCDTEGDAPSCSPLLKHTSSSAVALFAFHLWLPWTTSPWGGPASCGQAQLCLDTCLNRIGNDALKSQSHQHFQAGRKQHCQHKKCEVVLLPTALLPAMFSPSSLNWTKLRDLQAPVCSPQNAFSTNNWLPLHLTLQLFGTQCYCLLILKVTWRDHEYPIFHSPVEV